MYVLILDVLELKFLRVCFAVFDTYAVGVDFVGCAVVEHFGASPFEIRSGVEDEVG